MEARPKKIETRKSSENLKIFSSEPWTVNLLPERYLELVFSHQEPETRIPKPASSRHQPQTCPSDPARRVRIPVLIAKTRQSGYQSNLHSSEGCDILNNN
jgi:hypothetical protein